MKKLVSTCYFVIVLSLLCLVHANGNSIFSDGYPDGFYTATDTTQLTREDSIFNELELGKKGLGRRAYDYAMLGFNVLKTKGKLKNDKIITIADMSTPSGRKRLFVIDLVQPKLLYVTYVAHGKKSGLDKTLYFSNEPESHKTSVGFYITLGTYSGSHGYSMRLDGQEIGFNNNAEERDIVMHKADYVTEGVVKSQGFAGRSLGCPAVSPAIYRDIIETIKDGSCLFIFGNDKGYITNSKLLKRKPKLQTDEEPEKKEPFSTR